MYLIESAFSNLFKGQKNLFREYNVRNLIACQNFKKGAIAIYGIKNRERLLNIKLFHILFLCLNVKKWALLGSNQRPPDYESGALTN